ncbi:hypothetical protein [Salsipaludibacter albus]|uniref:hypothetical protein n=1 Tax=Salsipaludibacter albus TaxID=2849650 RepID=UPI001EE46A68|nr:hypothetical protein [Salsipaludibacter albus]
MTLAVFGAGYVLGTKAGRERYEQLRVATRLAAQRLEEYGDRGRTTNGATSDAASGSRGD